MYSARTRKITIRGGVALATLVVIGGVRLFRLFRSVEGYKRYWRERADTPGEFLYVALGDSVANAIGATRATKGYVGLIAQWIEQTTGRTVRVVNVSVTGATAASVIRDQLPKISGLRPDLVTLDVGANDVSKKIPEESFLRDFETILEALPEGKTIVADLPTFERGPKKSTLQRLNSAMHAKIIAHNFTMAPVFEVTSATIRDWRTYGADFFHPSNRGHRNWFLAFETQLPLVIEDLRTHSLPL